MTAGKNYDWSRAFDAIAAAMAQSSGVAAVSVAERQGLTKPGNAAETGTYQDKVREKTLGDETLEFRWHCYDPSHAYRAFPDVNVLTLELRRGDKILRRVEHRYED